ncbi:hypothetical protein [Serratia fonticola]|uniref:hypothetical protein n=1 Tax=Serratia fonticola TaxID=47917 RepID=UPI001AE3BFFA|nr:hypothetical protein [Serratia fonticola]MBP1037068.1 hypothetical protein [Serratia fonticola]
MNGYQCSPFPSPICKKITIAFSIKKLSSINNKKPKQVLPFIFNLARAHDLNASHYLIGEINTKGDHGSSVVNLALNKRNSELRVKNIQNTKKSMDYIVTFFCD